MFRTYQVLWNRIYQLLDAGIVMLSFVVAWYVKFQSGWLPYGGHDPFTHYMPVMLAAIPIFLFSNWLVGLYRPNRSRTFWRLTSVILRSLVVGLLLFMSFLYFLHVSQFSRTVLFVFGISFTLLSYIKHLGVRAVLRTMRARGYNKKFVVVVGWTSAAERFMQNLEQHPWFGYHVLGHVADGPLTVSVPHLGSFSKLNQVLENSLVDYVLICLPRSEVFRMPKVIGECESLGVQSLIVPDYFDLLPANPRFENFAGMPLIDTRYVPLDDALNALAKRTFDIVFSVLVLILLSPVFALIAIGVKLSSQGPVLFKQERAGRNRRIFTMFKFRTMWYEPNKPFEPDNGWTAPNDPRRTSFGLFLRKTSLDELPQFWNVLIGDMSVIGPRPERPGFVDRFREEIPRYMVKHRVRPGITGWAQVNGLRGDTSIEDRIAYDLRYIEHWSFGWDLKIVFITIFKGFLNKNAY
ncbi:undecaprenyl-phosphate glucose phosphotransferase [Alicyclobacillus tolerans]|uniref:undecaprenyl-phosphate glucose phosphotransferase n=1 Tax=Alicyclobacillus tolerans TaxID=90970 RepID=UPI001F42AA89|nr:undecaprenyl-phosphate glucose phosphotransferase [Alicyclobacillus tolerans]MCF8567856.1 undecaprenyl-phosphate glucose phosphotransferase [Alicyclobacillus tolerans]